jgi:hypothetical protein
MALLDMPFVAALRRNHALEHATMHILAQRQPYLNAVARTALDGFYVYGMVDTRALADTASEGLARLQAGETDLAVHPRCGTNLAVAGFLAGLAAFLAVGSSRRRLSTFPRFVLAATLAVIVAQPLGLMIQQHVTTSSDVAGLSIRTVTRRVVGRFTIHKVELEHSS